MQLKKIGNNQTQLNQNGNSFLFSYETLVACNINGQTFVTKQKYSSTTNRHIKSWVNGDFEYKTQAQLNDFLEN